MRDQGKNGLLLPELLPEDVDAERSLLATLCAAGNEETAYKLVPGLDEEDFLHPSHRALFVALSKLLKAHAEVNAITLKEMLARAGALDGVGGYPGLVELLSAEEVGRPASLVNLLQRKRRLRQLIRLGSQLAREAAHEAAPPEVLMGVLLRELHSLTGQTVGDDVTSFKDAALKVLGGEGLMPGAGYTLVRTGLPRLDREMNGWPGTLGVVCGKTSAGKTSLAIQMLMLSEAPYLLSMEMSDAEIEARALAYVTGMDSRQFLRGDFDKAALELRRLADDTVLQRLENLKKTTKFKRRDLTAICSKIEAVVRRFGVKTIFIDYLTLMDPPKMEGASVSYRVGQISTGLKNLMADLQTAGVVLAQLNRGVEDGERIRLEHLRESGQIEQDANWVMSVYTGKKHYDPGEIRDVTVELLKNRSGARHALAHANFRPWASTFDEVERVTKLKPKAKKSEDAPPPDIAGLSFE